MGRNGWHVNKALLTIACVALMAAAAPVSAQGSSSMSANITDRRTLMTQRKVDTLFDTGNFERAYFIYRNELAPLGDKYAQYMVGFMHVSGLGVEADDIQASAWYRLASERDTPEFVVVRNRLMRDFSADQLRRSDALYANLLSDYSDLVVLLTAIKRDMELISTRTGTRLTGEVSPVSIVDGRSNKVQSEGAYFRNIERRIEGRAQQLIDLGKFEGVDPDPARLNLKQLERLVEERIVNWKG